MKKLQLLHSDRSNAKLEKDELLRGELALNIKDSKLFFRSAESDDESDDKVKSIPLLDEEELKQYIKDNAPVSPDTGKGLNHFEDSDWKSDESKSVYLKPKSDDSNVTVGICPKGNGAFTLSDYGVKLGEKSVDLQIYNYSPVKTSYSVCTGGTGNNVNSDYSVICGGCWNTIQESSQGFIGGGVSNNLRGWNSAILCGSNNEINGNDANFIACGKENKMLGLEWWKDWATDKNDNYHAKFSFISGNDNVLQGESTVIFGLQNSIRGDSTTNSQVIYRTLITKNTNPSFNFIHGSYNNIAGQSWNTIIGSQSCQILSVNKDETFTADIVPSNCACISSFESKIVNSKLTATIGSLNQKIYNSQQVFLGPITTGGYPGIFNSKRVVCLAGDMSPTVTNSESVFWPLCTTGTVKNAKNVNVLTSSVANIQSIQKEDAGFNRPSEMIFIANAYSGAFIGSNKVFSSSYNTELFNSTCTLLLNSDAVHIQGNDNDSTQSQYNNAIGSRNVKLYDTRDILNLSSHGMQLGGAQYVTFIQCDNCYDKTSYESSSINKTYRLNLQNTKTVDTAYWSTFINSWQCRNISNSSRISVNNVRTTDISNVSLARIDCVVNGKLQNGYSLEGFGILADNLGMSNHSYHAMAEGTSIRYDANIYHDGHGLDTASDFVGAKTVFDNRTANANKIFQTGKVYMQLVMSEPDISKPTFMTKANFCVDNSMRPDAKNASFIVVPSNGYMFFDFKADFVNGTSVCTIEMKNGVLYNDGSKIEILKQPEISSNSISATNAIQLSIAQIEQETSLDVKQVAISVDSTLSSSAFASGTFDYRLMY